MSLRSLADRPVAGAALLGILSVAHGEVEVPGRSEVAHGLAVLEHLSGALVVPDAGGQGVALVGEVLSLSLPCLDGVVQSQLAGVVNQSGGAVVGEHTEGLGLGGGHVVTLSLGVSGDSVELVPAVQLGLNLSGIIGAQDVLGDGAAIDQSGGAALEGDTLDSAVGVGSGLHSVLIGVGEIGDAQSLNVLGELGIGVLQDVVSLSQEHIDLLVVSDIGLVQQSLVQLVLINAAVRGVDDPVDGDAFGNGVVLLEEALELLVPSVDVEDLAFLGGSGFGSGSGSLGSGGSLSLGSLGSSGSAAAATGGQAQNHNQSQQHCHQFFHVFSSLVIVTVIRGSFANFTIYVFIDPFLGYIVYLIVFNVK